MSSDAMTTSVLERINAKPESVSVGNLVDNPEQIIRLSNNEMYCLPLEDQRTIQFKASARRFEQMVEHVPLLRRLAAEQGLTKLSSIEDLGMLLVPHSACKSYPMSYLENGRFDRLTNWLQGFTSHDLSGVDASGCDTIDSWIDVLDSQSPIRVVHSTGTSGKLSFLARGEKESRQLYPGFLRTFDTFGDETPLLGVPVDQAPILYLQYRHGAYAQMRLLDVLERDLFGGDSSMILAINPGRFSADAVSLGGRLRGAEAKGELGRMQLSPRLLERRDIMLKEQEAAQGHLDAFLDEVASRFRGKAVSVMGHIPQLYRVAMAGLARGYENMFSKDSFVAGGGGLKGAVGLPDDWRDMVLRYMGVSKPTLGYGMSELVGSVRICPAGHYHIPPWVIPFLLDPVSGEQYPRTGVRVGRYGVFDLNAETYWAGFLTGDEVTLSWGDTDPCACGRKGAFLHAEIRRYSEQEGGDDKITCAGAPEAYDKAVDYIVQMGG